MGGFYATDPVLYWETELPDLRSSIEDVGRSIICDTGAHSVISVPPRLDGGILLSLGTGFGGELFCRLVLRVY